MLEKTERCITSQFSVYSNNLFHVVTLIRYYCKNIEKAGGLSELSLNNFSPTHTAFESLIVGDINYPALTQHCGDKFGHNYDP